MFEAILNIIFSEEVREFFNCKEIVWGMRLFAAAVFGLLLGTERALNDKPASFRTFSLVSCASCIFSILSVDSITMSTIADPTRVAAQVVSGVGFIGTGIIFKQGGNVEGITTAVMVWYAAALGMLCGFGEILFGGISLLIYTFILTFGSFLHRMMKGPKVIDND